MIQEKLIFGSPDPFVGLRNNACAPAPLRLSQLLGSFKKRGSLFHFLHNFIFIILFNFFHLYRTEMKLDSKFSFNLRGQNRFFDFGMTMFVFNLLSLSLTSRHRGKAEKEDKNFHPELSDSHFHSVFQPDVSEFQQLLDDFRFLKPA